MQKQVPSEPDLVSLSIRVTRETADALKRVADAEYRTVAAEIRRLIEERVASAEPSWTLRHDSLPDDRRRPAWQYDEAPLDWARSKSPAHTSMTVDDQGCRGRASVVDGILWTTNRYLPRRSMCSPRGVCYRQTPSGTSATRTASVAADSAEFMVATRRPERIGPSGGVAADRSSTRRSPWSSTH